MLKRHPFILSLLNDLSASIDNHLIICTRVSALAQLRTKNFQMYKLGLERAEEPEIKLSTLLDHRVSKGMPENKTKQNKNKKTHNIWFSFIDHTEVFDCVDHSKLWKILKEIGVSDYLTCLLRNLHSGQETVRTRPGTTAWFKIGKGVCQGHILSPCLFNLYAEYIMWNAGLDESWAGIKMAGRNNKNLRYADYIILMAEKRRGTKEPLDVGERAEWKSWLKTQH